MDKRQRLINMISESDDNWFQSTHFLLGGVFHPTYIEYMNLRHRLGLLPDGCGQRKLTLHPNDGSGIDDDGEDVETNRAAWRKWIEEHRNDDILDGLI